MRWLVYVVHWEAENIVKVGVTGGRRWQRFVGRGARLVHLFTPQCGVTAPSIERRMELAVSRICKPAFGDKLSADPYLGQRGAGWTECYRVPADQVEHVLYALLPSIASSNASSTSTDVTDGLTKRVVTSRDISYVSNARERRRILPRVDEAGGRPGRCAPGQATPSPTHPADNRTEQQQ